MPLYWLKAYCEMLPILSAEERLTEVEVAMAGGGNMQKRDREKLIASWRKTVGGSDKHTSQQAITNAQAMGIGVKFV